MAKSLDQRRDEAMARRVILETRRWCEAPAYFAGAGVEDRVGCAVEAAHVHERCRRAQGGDPTDPCITTVLCQPHHDLVHHEPYLAYEIGLLQRSPCPPCETAPPGAP